MKTRLPPLRASICIKHSQDPRVANTIITGDRLGKCCGPTLSTRARLSATRHGSTLARKTLRATKRLTQQCMDWSKGESEQESLNTLSVCLSTAAAPHLPVFEVERSQRLARPPHGRVQLDRSHEAAACTLAIAADTLIPVTKPLERLRIQSVGSTSGRRSARGRGMSQKD